MAYSDKPQPSAVLAYNSRMGAEPRQLMDRCIAEFDAALRAITTLPAAAASRDTPRGADSPQTLSGSEQDLAARLMRVNHAGEIAAQALYRGQALFARDEALRTHLLRAAEQEHDHLRWCETRARELGGRVSVLAPLWYAGALAIGAAASLAGDALSMGFLAETERQVTEHLDGHLRRLPAADHRSRAIVRTMRAEEIHHGREATERGGGELPAPVRLAMRAASKVMTTVAHYL